MLNRESNHTRTQQCHVHPLEVHVKPMGKENKVVDVISARAPRRRRCVAHVCRRGDFVPGKLTDRKRQHSTHPRSAELRGICSLFGRTFWRLRFRLGIPLIALSPASAADAAAGTVHTSCETGWLQTRLCHQEALTLPAAEFRRKNRPPITGQGQGQGAWLRCAYRPASTAAHGLTRSGSHRSCR